ncbi:23S rRNA (uracil(1939)-C(5))-methyltransferase RlmD [Mycoplasmopsis columbinasalis]|uniref:tRNA (Uracil-5-)-methyltransferase related enzyme n=1 Tax=Mycoplasmopsis columbinasalis TaxID=114880 RepID=A0A449B9S9_9BACT|nr:23S rRNA (uracil(1939)-C(5))-methyltransferase RlmD [Mycoplasmopsis columbinasalis]VEU77932.1 tRNA (uracil-5-)-methyltransferase related enzyme [Mycoplasmopsis columbinasalis]
MKIKQGQVLVDVTTDEFTYEGYGAIRSEDFVIFVDGLLPGELADIRIEQTYAKKAFGKILKIKKSSPDRVRSFDDQLVQSGVAPLAILNYESQLQFKEAVVQKLVERNLNFYNLEKIQPSRQIFNYRNKVKVFYQKHKDSYIFGNHLKFTNKIAQLSNLALAHQEINNLFVFFWNLIKEQNYDIGSSGEIILRYSASFDQLVLVIITSKQIIMDPTLILQLQKQFPNLIQVHLVIKTKTSTKTKTLVNKDKFTNKILDLTCVANWNTFLQINEDVTSQIYQELSKQMHFEKLDHVLDAFCGVGTIGLTFAKQVGSVKGVEVVPEAVENALFNARLNYLQNADFKLGDANSTILHPKLNKVVLDPPREGVAQNFLTKIATQQITRIGYISCNPHTFVRDAKFLLTKGYKLVYLKPFDMFPQTHHIELLGVFELANGKE